LKLIDKVDLIWEDVEVPYTWTKLLENIIRTNRPLLCVDPITWSSFLKQSGLNRFDASFSTCFIFIICFFSSRETALRDLRESNRRHFDAVWGNERYLLEDGVTLLPPYIYNSSIYPRIFTDWKAMNTPSNIFFNDSILTHTNINVKENSIKDSEVKNPSNSLKKQSTIDTMSMPDRVHANMRSETSSQEETSTLAILNMFRAKLKDGQFEEAYRLGVSVWGSRQQDPLFLLELGITQYLRGSYSAAFDTCCAAKSLAPGSSLINGCIGNIPLVSIHPFVSIYRVLYILKGMAGMYLQNKQNQTIEALVHAWHQMVGSSDHRSQAVLNRYRSPSIDSDSDINMEVGKKLLSGVIVLTRMSVENSLIQALNIFKRHEECVDLSLDLFGIPAVSQGGAYILIFSVVEWSSARYASKHCIKLVLNIMC